MKLYKPRALKWDFTVLDQTFSFLGSFARSVGQVVGPRTDLGLC